MVCILEIRDKYSSIGSIAKVIQEKWIENNEINGNETNEYCIENLRCF